MTEDDDDMILDLPDFSRSMASPQGDSRHFLSTVYSLVGSFCPTHVEEVNASSSYQGRLASFRSKPSQGLQQALSNPLQPDPLAARDRAQSSSSAQS